MERKICPKCNFYTWSEIVDTCPICGERLIYEDEIYEGFDNMAVQELDG